MCQETFKQKSTNLKYVFHDYFTLILFPQIWMGKNLFFKSNIYGYLPSSGYNLNITNSLVCYRLEPGFSLYKLDAVGYEALLLIQSGKPLFSHNWRRRKKHYDMLRNGGGGMLLTSQWIHILAFVSVVIWWNDSVEIL